MANFQVIVIVPKLSVEVDLRFRVQPPSPQPGVFGGGGPPKMGSPKIEGTLFGGPYNRDSIMGKTTRSAPHSHCTGVSQNIP